MARRDSLGDFAAAFAACGPSGGRVPVPRGISWVSDTLVVPNKVALAGDGRSASVIKALPGFPAGRPVVQLGDGLAFGSRLERLSVDCSGIAGVGLYSPQGQEMCGAEQVAVVNFTDTGIHMDVDAADFSIGQVECYPAASGARYGIRLRGAGSNLVHSATCGVSGHLMAGVYVDHGTAVVQSVHVENTTDGVLFDGANGFASGITGPTVNANVTNLVRMAANSRYVTLVDLTKNSATTTFVDDFHGLTVTDPYVQAAVLGDLYAARIHSPQLDALTVRVAALEKTAGIA